MVPWGIRAHSPIGSRHSFRETHVYFGRRRTPILLKHKSANFFGTWWFNAFWIIFKFPLVANFSIWTSFSSSSSELSPLLFFSSNCRKISISTRLTVDFFRTFSECTQVSVLLLLQLWWAFYWATVYLVSSPLNHSDISKEFILCFRLSWVFCLFLTYFGFRKYLPCRAYDISISFFSN